MEAALTTDKKRLAQMLKALGNPIRFQIMEYLASNQTCTYITNDIVRVLPRAQSTVSQHLKILKKSDLIRGEVDGSRTCYCLNREMLKKFKKMAAGL